MTPSYSSLFVTGSAGWLGRRLVQHLGEAFSLPVSGLDRTQGQDIQSPTDCRAFLRDGAGGLLVHTAGVIHPRSVKEFYAVNLRGTLTLLAAAKESGIRRVILVSSNSPIGVNPHRDHLFDEQSPYRPYMNYGRSKMQMEIAAQEFCAREGIECVIVRPPWFYGPGQPARQGVFFEMIRAGKVPVVGDGSNLRSMVYIDHLCEGIELAARKAEARREIYWIADERPYPMLEVIATIADSYEQDFGVKVNRRQLRLPFVVGEVAELVDWSLQKVGLYHQKFHVLSEMNKDIACSVDKARRELGYAPKVSLREGMRRSLEWHLKSAT